jgi:ABC-2 type transport system ATP-binding protein
VVLSKILDGGVSLTADASTCLGILIDDDTIMRLLIGQEKPKSGDVFFMGKSLKNQPYEALRNISYCPNECALQKYLTGRQNLEIFGSLNGFSKAFVNQEITNKIESLCLKEFIDEPVKNYSEANRKLLGIAIAAFGNPQIVILEEPFEDLEVVFQSRVCDLLNKMRVEGSTIIIVSTKFEDCAKICTKLAVIEEGELKYLDSPENSKSRFEGMVKVSMKLNDPNFNEAIKNFLERSLANVNFKVESSNKLTFEASYLTQSLSQIFTALEYCKQNYMAECCSVVKR